MKFATTCLLALVLSLGCTPAQEEPVPSILPTVEDGESFPEPGNPKCEPGCCPSILVPPDKWAGRYHLRGRTKQFFGRVS